MSEQLFCSSCKDYTLHSYNVGKQWRCSICKKAEEYKIKTKVEIEGLDDLK